MKVGCTDYSCTTLAAHQLRPVPVDTVKRKADFETDGAGVNQRKRVAAVTSCDAGDSPPDSEPSNDDAGILVAPDGYSLDDGLLHMFNEAASAFAGSPPAEASLVEAPTMPNQTKTGSQDITAEAASQKSGSDGTGHKSDKGRNLFPTWRVLPGRGVGRARSTCRTVLGSYRIGGFNRPVWSSSNRLIDNVEPKGDMNMLDVNRDGETDGCDLEWSTCVGDDRSRNGEDDLDDRERQLTMELVIEPCRGGPDIGDEPLNSE
ncbi:hypothetical protein FOZ63_008072, partial [Perkinsus olseni]